MLGGITAIVAIILFVVAHEAGHFIAAKALGMKATEFFFGFGPKLWSTKRGETEYGFKLLPLGGYVRIVGMNPLEDVPPEDMGRTYREKKFWQKSVVVLSGVGMNFLIAFLLLFGVVLANGVPGDPTTEVGLIVEGAPADAAGVEVGDVIVGIGSHDVAEWPDVVAALQAVGTGPTRVSVMRQGELIILRADLVESERAPGVGFLGISPIAERVPIGPFRAAGVAGQQLGNGVVETFRALGRLVSPSSIAQFVGVFGGETDIPDEIRPVSPIGIVGIGAQIDNVTFFIQIMALINIFLATLNVLPLFPLDGGHFAVAVYEKVTGRQADIRRLVPVAAAVIAILIFLGFVAIILDLTSPINI